MDGRNLKITGDILKRYFVEDSFGSIIPKPDSLQMGEVQSRVERQLSADTGLASRMIEMYNRTDVQFTDNPHGNSPVLGFGVKLFGRRPIKGGKRSRGANDLSSVADKVKPALEKRQRRFVQYQRDIMALHTSLEPEDKESKEYLLWLVEQDQSMTGGGFDGNSIGEVQLSALNFVNKSNSQITYADTVLSKYVVEGSLWLKDHLQRNGLQLGTLEPEGASEVRFDQDTDGMLGFPVYSKGNAPLTKEIAQRLLIETGVSTVEFVNSSVTDRNSGVEYKYRVIDALAYCLDHMVIDPKDAPSIVTLLARIQKHGWKMDGENLIAKPGKTRSVYPNAAIPGLIEAMTMAPFMKKIKENKVPFMPSLQDKANRVEMITSMVKNAFEKGYDYLAADWSKYDATVKGHIFATILKLAVRPFFRAQYYNWVDFSIYALTYKYIVTNTNLCNLHEKEFSQAKHSGEFVEVDDYTIFGLTDGLISGAKITHGGGSMYGEVVIHYVIPKYLKYEPIIGAQAGDDTLMAIPIDRIDLSSAEETYKQISQVAEVVGLEMNPSKQIWHNVLGEVVKVFLQESYHLKADIWGVGSIFRPLDALPTSERDKGLSIAEQMMAEIARMNGGSDSPFVSEAIQFWFEREQFLGILFKEYGANAFEVIVQSIGLTIEEVAQRIDVGSFTWGIGIDELRSGSLPILPLMANVSAEMFFVEDISKVLKSLEAEELMNEGDVQEDPNPLEEEESSLTNQ